MKDVIVEKTTVSLVSRELSSSQFLYFYILLKKKNLNIVHSHILIHLVGVMELESIKQKIINLIQERPQYGPILLRAVEIEENPPNEFISRYGWEWHDVQAIPAHLTKLVGEGILKITYKSRRYTHYKLINLQQTKEALKELGLTS